MKDLLQQQEREFDEKFGKDGPDRNCDSLGRIAGCDDCESNIKLRAEHKQFLLSQKIELLEKVVEMVKNIKDEYAGDEDAFNNGLQAMKGDVLSTLQETIKEIK